MKTSQNNTRLIEKYLNGSLSPADRFLFESRLVIDPVLKRDFIFRKNIPLDQNVSPGEIKRRTGNFTSANIQQSG